MDSRVSGRPAAASLSGAAGGGAASEESGCACADAPGAHVASSIATINRRVARMEIRPDVGPQDFVLAYRSESSWTILLPFLAEGVGFEPTREREPPGGFQDRCLKPLGHPSLRQGLANGRGGGEMQTAVRYRL